MTLNPQQLPDWLESMVEECCRAIAATRGVDPDEVIDVFRNRAWSWYEAEACAALAEAAPKIVERMAGIAQKFSRFQEGGPHADAPALIANAIRREVNSNA